MLILEGMPVDAARRRQMIIGSVAMLVVAAAIGIFGGEGGARAGVFLAVVTVAHVVVGAGIAFLIRGRVAKRRSASALASVEAAVTGPGASTDELIDLAADQGVRADSR